MKICLLGLLLVLLVAKGFADTDPIDTGDVCRCPGATLACIRADNKNSTNRKCPQCPMSCPSPIDECRTTECPDGERCEVEDDADHKCIPDVTVGNKCSYIKNCVNRKDCESEFSGEKREKQCASGLFCRATTITSNCLVDGTCVTRASASIQEARCIRNVAADVSRCSLDGDYRCYETESTDDGRERQTCYNPATGVATKTVISDSLEDVARIECRENLATCTAISGKRVLSGDRVDDPNDRCSYCLCKNGTISRTQCITIPNCVPNPRDCTFKGETVPHGKTVTFTNGCVQKRCRDGLLVEFGEDTDCDGENDVDVCAGQSDRDIVCVRSLDGVRARVPKCKAMSITGATYSDRDCDEEEDCNCERDKICVPSARPIDQCVDTTGGSGCKAKRCISKADSFTCSTLGTNRRVCSASGNSYSSECVAFVNQDYTLKYLRDCNNTVCKDNNNGRGFCGFDRKTYPNLCHLERKTGKTLHDYKGTCEANANDASSKCEDIPEGCNFKTRASDASCLTPGGQGILHIDLDETREYAARKGKADLDINDLCEVVESDWEKLTGFNVNDGNCELTCRSKYDIVGALVVHARAARGAQCVTCGNRMRSFIAKVREEKSTNTVPGSRTRRQTDESEYSGLFINPSELNNDLSGAYNLIASSLLILTSVILALMF